MWETVCRKKPIESISSDGVGERGHFPDATRSVFRRLSFIFNRQASAIKDKIVRRARIYENKRQNQPITRQDMENTGLSARTNSRRRARRLTPPPRSRHKPSEKDRIVAHKGKKRRGERDSVIFSLNCHGDTNCLSASAALHATRLSARYPQRRPVRSPAKVCACMFVG